MKTDTHSLRGIRVVELAGKLTIEEGTPQLRAKVRELLGAGATRLVLDLSKVTYADSTGIGTLVESYTSTTNRGGQLKLLKVTPKVRHLLSITRLLTVFETFEDEESSVRSFSSTDS